MRFLWQRNSRYASQSIEKKIVKKICITRKSYTIKCKFFWTSSKNRVIQIRTIGNRVKQGMTVFYSLCIFKITPQKNCYPSLHRLLPPKNCYSIYYAFSKSLPKKTANLHGILYSPKKLFCLRSVYHRGCCWGCYAIN